MIAATSKIAFKFSIILYSKENNSCTRNLYNDLLIFAKNEGCEMLEIFLHVFFAEYSPENEEIAFITACKKFLQRHLNFN